MFISFNISFKNFIKDFKKLSSKVLDLKKNNNKTGALRKEAARSTITLLIILFPNPNNSKDATDALIPAIVGGFPNDTFPIPISS